ncbi:hypothetical protein DF22_002492, partial [Xylella fastidiosa]
MILERGIIRSCAHVAQSVEHLLGKEEVDGSIPFVSTIRFYLKILTNIENRYS